MYILNVLIVVYAGSIVTNPTTSISTALYETRELCIEAGNIIRDTWNGPQQRQVSFVCTRSR